MEFYTGDIFETDGSKFWVVSGVIHDQRLVYALDDNGEEIEFGFDEVTTHWSKQ